MLKISSLLLLASLLTACTSLERHYKLDVTNCDPRERNDCFAIRADLIETLGAIVEDNARMKAALEFCQKKI